jgi:hypothetical protein
MCCKQAFDEVFVKYARSIKPDLIVAQWNHLSDFSQISGDERCMLPAELWGKGEDYLWYSTGAAACFTDLAEGILGEGALQARYIRGAFDDKPFTLGKYESTRTRVAIAELAANGGAPMGFYTRFKDPMAREEIVRYYRFMDKNDAVYHGNRSHAEVLLLYPRSRVHAAADVAAVEAFKKTGKTLLDRHVLFDVLPDDMATAERRAAYRAVVDPSSVVSGASGATGASGASVPSGTTAAAEASGNNERAGKAALSLPPGLSSFTAPSTVRVSASTPSGASGKPGEITLHFVNYNREEPAKKRSAGTGIKDEKPIAVEGVGVDLVLPAGAKVTTVRVSSPELPEAVEVKHAVTGGRVRFTVPKFLVYSIARVELGSP